MRLGSVHLIVTNLANQLRFFQQYLGLTVHWQQDNRAGLGAGGEDLLVMHEHSDAQRDEQRADIYHTALYMPDRHTFARTVARLTALSWPNHPTDHLVSETTYLDDPEGNTIELTFETPERGSLVVPEDGGMMYGLATDGTRHSGRDAMNVQALFAELSKDDVLMDPLPITTRIHHVHLYGSSLQKMDWFYRELIGFRRNSYSEAMRMADYGPEGYPVHMLAFNTWRGETIPAKSPQSAGLRYFTLVLDGESELRAVLSRLDQAGIAHQPLESGELVYDPSGLGLLLRSTAIESSQ